MMKRVRAAVICGPRHNSLFPIVSTAVIASAAASSSLLVSSNCAHASVRSFSSVGRMTDEYGFGNRLRDIPTLSGSSKPVVREGDWVSEEALTETMEVALPRVLRRRNWNELEIQRELDYFFLRKSNWSGSSILVSWRTVEDFQRTPWHRRFRTADGSIGQYLSYECLKALEEALVPPSMRGDPYAHLRKRHLEEQYQSEPYSESAAKKISREKLAALTPGMPEYGKAMSRAKYMEFAKKYKKNQSTMSTENDSYHAWLSSLDQSERSLQRSRRTRPHTRLSSGNHIHTAKTNNQDDNDKNNEDGGPPGLDVSHVHPELDVSQYLSMQREVDPEWYANLLSGEGPVSCGASFFNKTFDATNTSAAELHSGSFSGSSNSRRFASFFELQDRPMKTLSFEDFSFEVPGCGERMPGLLAAVSHPEQAAMEIALDILDPMQIPGASLSDTQVAQFFALMGISIDSQLLDDLLKETWGWVRGRQFYLQDLLQVYTWWRGVGCTRLPAPPEMTTLAVGNSNVDPSFVLAASLSRSKSSKSLDSEEKDVVNEAEEVDPLIDREDRVLASKYAALRRTRMAINPIVGYDEEVTQQLTQQHTQSIVDQLHRRLQQQLEAKDEKAVAGVAEMGIAVSAAVPKVAASDGDDDDESPNKSKNSSLEHYGSLVGTTNTAMGLPWYNPHKIWLVDSQPRVILSIIMVVVALAYYNAIMARNTSFAREFHIGWLLADLFITLLYMFDVFMWTRTAILDDQTGLLVQQPALIKKWYYRKGWMVVDVLACIPLDIFFYCLSTAFEDGGSTKQGLGIASAVCNHLRALKSLRTFYSFGITGQSRFTKFYLEFFSNYLPILLESTFVFYVVVTLAMLYVLVKYINGSMYLLGDYPYVTGIYYIVQTFTTVGYGDVPIGGVGETVFLMVLMFVSLIGNGVVIGRMMSLVMRPTVDSIRQDNLRQLLAVLQFFRIPKPLQIEILNFQGHVLWTDVSSTFEDQLAPLPLVIRENVETVRRVRVLYNAPYFRFAHDAVIVSLASKMQWRTYRPEEYISFAGEPHEGVRFVMFGFIDVLHSSGRYLRTIKKGDVLGVHDLLCHGALSGSILFPLRTQRHSYKSISYADLYVLSPEALFETAVEFPRFGDQFAYDTTRDKSILRPPEKPLSSSVGASLRRFTASEDIDDMDHNTNNNHGGTTSPPRQPSQTVTVPISPGAAGGGNGFSPNTTSVGATSNSFSGKKVSFVPSTSGQPLINFGFSGVGTTSPYSSGAGIPLVQVGDHAGGDRVVNTESVSMLRSLVDGLMEDLNASIQEEEGKAAAYDTTVAPPSAFQH